VNGTSHEGVTPTYRVATITPDLAREWLKRNTRNRTLSERRVRSLAEAMKRGEWYENGDAIRFSVSGVLLDGQTRLAAVVMSGCSIRSLVAENLPDDAQITMDVGSARTFAAVLQILGYKDAGYLASLTRLAYLYETGQVRHHNRPPTHQQLLHVVEKHHDEFHESLRVAQSVRRQLPISRTTLALAHWLFVDIEPADAEFFFTRLRDGQGLVEGDAIFALRRAILLDAASSRPKLAGFHVLALIIKAWNAYRAGQQVTLLAWRPGGARPEPFPVPK
jgi:hypothetical protein